MVYPLAWSFFGGGLRLSVRLFVRWRCLCLSPSVLLSVSWSVCFPLCGAFCASVGRVPCGCGVVCCLSVFLSVCGGLCRCSFGLCLWVCLCPSVRLSLVLWCMGMGKKISPILGRCGVCVAVKKKKGRFAPCFLYIKFHHLFRAILSTFAKIIFLTCKP